MNKNCERMRELMKNRLKRSIALIITFAMIISMLPSNLIVAKATESAGTVVYLKDTIGGETRTLTETTSDVAKGWAWNAETATLTLSGFNGEYIEAEGDLNIVLNGTNTVTVPSSGGIGIDIKGNLTIDDTTSVAADVLNVKVKDAQAQTILISADNIGSEDTTINGGTVNLTGTTKGGNLYGFYYGVYVYNDAILNVDLSDEENNKYVSGCDSPLYLYTSSPVSICVDSLYKNSRAMYSCYYYGTGALNISALGNSQTVTNTFKADSAASGPVNVKGYISGKEFNTGKWKVKGYDNYIWYNDVSGQTGSYLLCDSSGNPIKDPVIEKYDNLPLRFMDSACFDVASIKVGESYSGGIYPIYGCEGGTGEYKFALADDSAPLPDGISINKYYGYISGTATAIHPAGTAKIKVTSGSESDTFEINYGAVTEPDYKYTIAGTEYEMKEDATGTGWSYEPDTKTLTLSGYNSGPITAESSLNIVLNGTNTITVPSSGGTGIDIKGNLTIDDTMSVAADVLNVKVKDAQAQTILISADNIGSEDTTINGGTVNLTGTTKGGNLYGFYYGVYVYNDAILNVDLSDEENNKYVSGCDSPLYLYTSSPVSICVDSLYKNSRAMYSCYYYGTGALNISALGNSQTVTNTFKADSAASGPVNVKGYISGKEFNTGKWKVKGYDNYIWYNDVSGQTGSYLLCDSSGNPIKDPVIEKYDNLPLRFMDSACFDVASIKVGESYSGGIYPIYGCEGGTGEYKFALADDSAPLPDGISINKYYGYISGTATAIHPAGTAKIKVTSGSESATFEINYGAVTYKNPVTGVSLDKEEIILNKGESKELTATVLPDTADNCDVKWNIDDYDIAVTEDEDESTNTRKVIVEAKSYADAGVYNVTVTTDAGSFQKTCKVYVKETKPAGEADGDYIVGLKADAGYTVNGVAKTADSNGRIFIEDSWRKTTVSIVKTNTEAKCNSDVQELAIGGKELQANKVTLEYSSVDYDGTAKTPIVIVMFGDTTLTETTDYTLEYSNNTNAGTAKVTVTGTGLYSGTVEKTFTIMPLEMTGITVSGYSGVYDGNPHTVTVTGLPDGATITYSAEYDGEYVSEAPQRTEAGETRVYYKIVKANYKTIEGQVTIRVVGTDIADADVVVSPDTHTFDGTGKEPTVAVSYSGTELVEGTDYTVAYENNINVGTANVIVTGKGGYEGTVEKTFTINPKAITPTVTLSNTAYTYNGKVQKPTVTVKDGENVLSSADYTVAYASGCTNAGSYKVTVTLKGNYSGSATATYTIKAKAITPTVTLSKTAYTYNGKVQKPTVTVKIGTTTLAAANYTVTYASGCKNAGSYKVTVTLKGNYSGSVTKTFTIKAKAITPTVTLSKTTYTYNGKVQKPTVTVKNGTSKLTTASYTVTYSSGCKNAGTYKVTVKLKGNYSGTATKTYKIKAKAVTPKVTLSKTTYTYNGKAQKPTVTVKIGTTKLSSSNYTVTYASGRKNVGKYKVTVKLKGNYSGSASKTFTIKPKATTLSKLTAGTKKLTATWKKLTTQTTGYQIQYSTSAKFTSAKTVTVSKNTTTKKTISKLKSGKKYYVRIRTYKTVKVSGKSTKIYSSWSKYMSVKVK